MDIELLKRLCDTPGISGREQQVRALTVEALAPLVDGLYVDDLGNLIGVKEGAGPKVMVCAHMDEIGFMVSHIDDRGFLRFVSVGGNRVDFMESQRVIVHSKQPVPGVLFRENGGRSKVKRTSPCMEEFYVDIGLPKERVEELVEIGDQITMDRQTVEMGEMMCGKAMDDRAGVFVMIEALRRVRSHEAMIYAVGSVQEEVGCRGSKVAAYGLFPDVAIALDVCPARDVPGYEADEMMSALDRGVAITVKDGGTFSDPRLTQFLRRIASEEGIPYQMQIASRGGTDARQIHQARSGVPSITLPIPGRYTHSAMEMVHRNDLEACANLVARFLERAHEAKFGESEELK